MMEPKCERCYQLEAMVTALQEAVRQQHRLVSYILASTTTDADREAVKKALLEGPDSPEEPQQPPKQTEGKGDPVTGSP